MNSSLKKRHHVMVNDLRRTPVLEEAIHTSIQPDSLVFDLGCGTGILSFFACNAGALHVYACDIDPESRQILTEAKRKGLEEKITFFNNLSSDVKLPKGLKVDFLIAETVGSLGLDENILPFLIDARTRFLKKDGQIIPSRLKIFVAPFHKDNLEKKSNLYQTAILTPEELLAEPVVYADLNLKKIKEVGVDHEVTFKIKKSGTVTGFAGWIEVEWAEGFTTKTSPWDPPTHWKQGILINEENLTVKTGDQLLFRLIMSPKEDIFSTESSLEWGFKKLT